jgi:thymidylate synthase (FAD)
MADVLNAGKVELVDSMGSELSVVQAERISNGAAMPEWRDAKDEKLIRYLAKHEHMTPFEHATFKFYVKAPIFVIREWQRHRTFSYNELSARYKELPAEFFLPAKMRGPDPVNRQSSVEWNDGEGATDEIGRMIVAYEWAYDSYTRMLKNGVAREIARSVLPVGIYSEMYVTGNFRNWMHFYGLRTGEGAQKEIRDYAVAIGEMLREKMPISFDALSGDYDGVGN